MTPPHFLIATLCGVLLACCACQQHPAQQVASQTLEGLKYRDAAGVAAHHIEGTSAGTYCRSAAFGRVLTKLRQAAPDPALCQRLRQPQAAPPGEADPAGLLRQVGRFVCEDPQGGCREYGRRVFSSQLQQSGLWQMPISGYRVIKATQRSPEEATVYVDITRAGRTHHHMLHVRAVEGAWVVTDDLGDWGSEP